MEIPKQYLDLETGEILLPEVFRELAIVKHHAMFTKAEQNKRFASKILRTRVKVPMLQPDEKDLHANVEPPIVPSDALATTAIRFLDHCGLDNPLERFDALKDQLLVIASTDKTRAGDEAWRLHENFEQQREFMNRTHFIGEVLQLDKTHKECES